MDNLDKAWVNRCGLELKRKNDHDQAFNRLRLGNTKAELSLM